MLLTENDAVANDSCMQNKRNLTEIIPHSLVDKRQKKNNQQYLSSSLNVSLISEAY